MSKDDPKEDWRRAYREAIHQYGSKEMCNWCEDYVETKRELQPTYDCDECGEIDEQDIIEDGKDLLCGTGECYTKSDGQRGIVREGDREIEAWLCLECNHCVDANGATWSGCDVDVMETLNDQSDDYYAKNLAVQVGAREDEIGEVAEMLMRSNKILADMAEKFLKEIRGR